MAKISEFLEIAKYLIEVGGFRVNVNNPFIFVSRLPSPCYIDCRRLISHPEFRAKVVDLLVYYIDSFLKIPQFDVIVGAATAGIPYAAWVSDRLKLPMAYVRKSEKDHGTKDQVSGIIKKNNNILIIEDLITFGSSLINFQKAISDAGGLCKHCLSIVCYEHIKISRIEGLIDIHYLISGRDIAEYANKIGNISKAEYGEISEWLDDPKSWTGKRGFDWSDVKYQ